MIFLRINLQNFVQFTWGNATVSPVPLVLISFGGTAFPLDYTTDVTSVTHMMYWLREYARGLTYQTLVNAFLFTVTKGRKEGIAIYVTGCTLAMMTMTTINESEGLNRPTFDDDFFTAV